MKICIITRIDYRNYGNRLQNYALKRLFDAENWISFSGLQVYSKKEWEDSSTGVRKYIKKLIPFPLFYIGLVIVLGKREINRKQDLRRVCFKRFTEKYIPTLPKMIIKNNKHLELKMNKYGFDFYVAGSDQIWNPWFSARDYEFLVFAPMKKRLSFAASIGVDTIPCQQKDRFKDLLNQMKFISVREQTGVNIIQTITGRHDIHLTLDPTLLLDSNEWEALSSQSKMLLPNHFIATYFLGSIPEAVYKFSEKLGIILIELNNSNAQEFYNIDPIDFLAVMKKADYVLTDSFHGVAFSIKFHKEFYVVKRAGNGQVGMFSRINDLLNQLDILNRIQDRDSFTLTGEISLQKWQSIDCYLTEQRDKALYQLKNAMH